MQELQLQPPHTHTTTTSTVASNSRNSCIHREGQTTPISIGATSTNTMDQSHQNAADVRFSCNICFEAVYEPVVTACGHLYCWSCLYKWLEPGLLPHEREGLGLVYPSTQIHNASKRVCPVCKAPCSVKGIIPIYVRNNTEHRSVSTSSLQQPTIQRQLTTDSGDCILDDQHVDTNERIDTSGNREPMGGVDESRSGTTSTTTTTDSRQTSSPDAQYSDRTNEESTNTAASTVPRRPGPQSPSHSSSASGLVGIDERNSTWVISTSNSPHRQDRIPLSPASRSAHPASLSHGMMPLVQHALGRRSDSSVVPPLYRLGQAQDGGMTIDDLYNADPSATEFLSRLLLLLGSFVIFCLLLF